MREAKPRRFATTLLTGLLWAGLAGGAQAQTLPAAPCEIPGEGLEGTLLPEPTYVPERPLIRLDAEEAKALAGERGTMPGCADSQTLPPILVTVSRGYYEQVAYTVTETVPAAAEHRRRSLSSRGGAQPAPVAAPEVRTRTVYKNVYRNQGKKLDLSPIIHKFATKYELDPWLLRGVIEVESAFRPSAVSCAGAGGLMQLMPGTASYLGCRDRFDPEQNIEAGARYLRMMLDRFNQNHDLAIAAYNAGPGNVARYGGIPPFAETQNYVKKVRRAWQWRPGQR